MPSSTIQSDDHGDWYQIGTLTLSKWEWRRTTLPIVNPTIRLSVIGYSGSDFNSFCYVRLRYKGVSWDGRKTVERSTRYYPDQDRTVILMDSGIDISQQTNNPWAAVNGLEKYLEIMLRPYPKVVPTYAVFVEELKT